MLRKSGDFSKHYSMPSHCIDRKTRTQKSGSSCLKAVQQLIWAREKKIFISQEKMLERPLSCGKVTSFTDMEPEKAKKVSFALTDDVAYVYKSTPSKYLLYGKYNDDLLGKRVERKETTPPVSILRIKSESLRRLETKAMSANNGRSQHADGSIKLRGEVREGDKKNVAFALTSKFAARPLFVETSLEGDQLTCGASPVGCLPELLHGISRKPGLTSDNDAVKDFPRAVEFESSTMFSPSQDSLDGTEARCKLLSKRTSTALNDCSAIPTKGKPLISSSFLNEGSRDSAMYDGRLPSLTSSKVRAALFGCIHNCGTRKSLMTCGRVYPAGFRLPTVGSKGIRSLPIMSASKPIFPRQVTGRRTLRDSLLENVHQLREERFLHSEFKTLEDKSLPRVDLSKDWSCRTTVPTGKISAQRAGLWSDEDIGGTILERDPVGR